MVEHHLRLEALGVLQEALHQLGALHAVDVGGPVVHLGGGHQLAALGQAGHQGGLEVGAGGVDRGGVAGGAGAQDQDVAVGRVGHDLEEPFRHELCASAVFRKGCEGINSFNGHLCRCTFGHGLRTQNEKMSKNSGTDAENCRDW